MLTRCNAEHARLKATNRVWYTFGDDSFEGFLLVWTESKVNDAIDFGKVSKLLPHVGQGLAGKIRIYYNRDIFNET